jgi:hypothetical protein
MEELLEGDRVTREAELREQLAQTLHKVLVVKREDEMRGSNLANSDLGLVIRAKDRFAPRASRTPRRRT